MINPMLDKNGNISEAGFNDWQKGVSKGFELAIEALKNLRRDYDEENEGALLHGQVMNAHAMEVIDRCIEQINDDASMMLTTFQDESYDENAPEAEGDRPLSEFLWKPKEENREE